MRTAAIEEGPGAAASCRPQTSEQGSEPSEIGTPQGGPLSPLWANILRDQFDQELERRGHRFARYADDRVIRVKSQRAGERVMHNLTRYLESRLKLKVNPVKSKVAPMSDGRFLGSPCAARRYAGATRRWRTSSTGSGN